MASSPLRAPAAAVAGQQQSRLLDMQVSVGGAIFFFRCANPKTSIYIVSPKDLFIFFEYLIMLV